MKNKKAAAAGYGHKRARKSTPVVATFTTGILRRNPGTNFAVVDAVNLSRLSSRRVAVQVIDWSNGTPVALPVSPCNRNRCVVTVPVNMSRFLFADVSNVAFTYEVRVTRIVDRNLVTNVFGLSNTPLTPQTGNNVLERELVRLRRMK
ncbi:hypothetical protein [Paenibacillus kobensis]|uniref:hypothetical protein n=1 Tax=Paenibacillus kobensis TaxID=59841 RepID=UPI001FE2A151|nr:hypothetical protein [Paenibacillus kobensis]